MADWDTTNPTDNAIVAQFPANERAARSALVTNFAVNHRGTNDANVGKHTVVSLLEQSAQTATAGEGKLYAVDTAGRSELFWISDTGSPIQITSGANGLLVNASNITSGTLADARLSANVPLLNAANAFTASQTISGTDKRLRFVDGAAPAGQKEWFMMNNNGVMQLWSATDGTSAFEIAFQVSKNTASEVTTFAILADSITLNGVASSDFARLSQANTFTGQMTIGTGNTTSNPLRLVGFDAVGDNYITFYEPGLATRKAYLGFGNAADDTFHITNEKSGAPLTLLTTGGGVISLNGVNVADYARLSQANVFTADQSITKALPVSYLHNTTGAASDRAYHAYVSNSVARVYTGIGDLNTGMTRADYNIRIVAGDMTVSRDDGGTISFKVGSSLANSSINGVAFNDFPRLSQTNTWTNGAQGITATGGAWSITDGGNTSAFSQAAIGSVSSTTFSIKTGNTSRVTISTTGAITTNDSNASEFGYKGAPQNVVTSNYTLVLADAGKTVKATSSAGTITIPDDASVVHPDGTIIQIHNRTGGNITITKTTAGGLKWNGFDGSTGARTLANNSTATIYKSQGDEWLISGAGLT